MAKFTIHASVTEDRVLAACMRRLHSLDNPGICLFCGVDQDGCEPDARRYTCDSCGMKFVYGADEIIVCGYYHRDKQAK